MRVKRVVPRSLLVGFAMAAAIVVLPTAASADVTATEGMAFTATVGTVGPNCGAAPATINWDDGSASSAATIAGTAIQGTHTYRIAGT
jgi:hypothetical protein